MKLLVTLGAFLFSSFIIAAPLKNIVVFGDSLSDNGNLYEFMKRQVPESPPYYEGRFSDGPVWIERLAASYFPTNAESRLQNYAFGGAGVSEDIEDDVLFTLRKEVNTYLLANDDKASPDDLFVVWIGANNYLGLPSNMDQSVREVNAGIIFSLKRLADKGAKNFLILNIPDLGRVPAATEFDSVELLRDFTKKHNAMLSTNYEALKTTYPNVNWMFFDMNYAFSDVIDHPEAYGFTNITGTCFGSTMNKTTKKSVLNIVTNVGRFNANQNNCDEYLFFDLVHPTAKAHQAMSDKARAMLDSVGVEFSD